MSRDRDVTDRASADETPDRALNEGHRSYFVENARDMSDIGLGDVPPEERADWFNENYVIDASDLEEYLDAFAMYEEFGEHAIDAWDYSRALNLCSFYYMAGYYTEEEALDKSLEIA